MDRATERFLLVISVSVITAVAFEAVAVGTAMPTVASRLHGLNLYAVAMGIPLAAQLVTTAFAGLWCDAKSPQSCLHLGIGVLSAGLVALYCRRRCSTSGPAARRAVSGAPGTDPAEPGASGTDHESGRAR